jgi:small-conductance mechanosensitive channel
MKKSFLTDLGLSDEDAQKVLDKVKEETESGNEGLQTQINDLTAQLNTANETIKGFDGIDVADMKNKIAEYQNTINTMKTESAAKLKSVMLDNAINTKVADIPEKYRKLIASQIDREKLSIADDNSVSGLEEQYLKLKDSYPDLFTAEEKPFGFGFSGGDDSKPTGSVNNTLANIFGVKTN